MAVQFNFNINNEDKPKTQSSGQAILAHPNTIDWFQLDPRYVTQEDGTVSVIRSRTGSGRTLNQPAVTEQAALVSDAINGFPALRFSGTEYYTLSNAPDPETAFTWALIYRPSALADDTIFGSRSDNSNQTNFRTRLSDGGVAFAHGSGIIVAGQNANAWNLAAMGSDTANISLSMNAGPFQTAETNNQGGPTTYVLGALNSLESQAFEGDVADILLFDNAPADNAEVLAHLYNYCKNTYAMKLAV